MRNREILDRALEELRKGLSPFVLQSLMALQVDARQTIVEQYALRRPYPASVSGDQNAIDVNGLLRLLLERWNEVFRDKLDPIARGYASELRAIRNKFAHPSHDQEFSDLDTDRALDTMARLLRLVSAPSEENAIQHLRSQIERSHAQIFPDIQKRSDLAANATRPIESIKALWSHWDSVGWDEFEGVLVRYRDEYFLKRKDEQYYVAIYEQLASTSISQRAQHASLIVQFLNRWHCRFSREIAPVRLSRWITDEAIALERLASVAIDTPFVLKSTPDIQSLYNSLFALRDGGYREGIHNMSDACASKILHLLVPGLFVMWDAKIRPTGWSYGRFISHVRVCDSFTRTSAFFRGSRSRTIPSATLALPCAQAISKIH